MCNNSDLILQLSQIGGFQDAQLFFTYDGLEILGHIHSETIGVGITD